MVSDDQKQTFGYMGKILHVDLSTEKTWVEEPPENFYRTYMGGAALIGYYLLKENSPAADPLDAGNALVFSSGVLTGIPVSGAGRSGVGARSPLTGGFAHAEAGGHWGAELKLAGWDAVIIHGKAARPVYLEIVDDRVAIRDASDLWGLEVLETEAAIKARMGEQHARVASIGPAGERLVRFAAIVNDRRSVAGRSGMGAVMGAKNLKAIGLRGHHRVPLADSDRIKELARKMIQSIPTAVFNFHEYGTGAAIPSLLEIGNMPIRNWGDGTLQDGASLSAIILKDTIRVGMESCYACAVRCKKMVQVGAPWNVRREYGGPEYETIAGFGSNCGVVDLKAVSLANQICAANGLDTISASGTVAFAMECFERGILTREDTGGIELRFGNAQAMIQVLRLITERKGIGNVLAEGSRQAARLIGRGSEEFAVHVKGLEAGYHDPRLKPGLGIAYAINPVGADHMVQMHDTSFATPEGMSLPSFFGVLDPVPVTDLGPQKARLLATVLPWAQVQDSLLMCQFVPWSADDVVELVKATTGWKTSLAELHKVGQRALAMGRLFNHRCGISLDYDVLPPRFFQPTKTGPHKDFAMPREAWLAGRDWTYRLLGWDPATGLPTPAKLVELGLDWLLAT